MRIQYASGRSQLPFSASDVTVTSGGTTTAAVSLYFAIQGANPAGVNLLSSIVGPIAIAAGQQVTIQVGSRLAGEFWESYVISASLSNDPATFVQVARIAAIDEDSQPLPLPRSVTLSRDSHLALSAHAATVAALPTNPVHGALRFVDSLATLFEFVAGSTLIDNGTTVLTAIGGRWLQRPGNFSSAIASLVDGGGCDRPLELLSSTLLRAPRYAVSGGNGIARHYWIRNTTSENVEAGLRVGLTVLVNNTPQSDLFDNLLRVRFSGYAMPSTGAMRTIDGDGDAFPDLTEKLYSSRKSDLRLPDALLPGEAYAITVYPNFTLAEVFNRLPQLGVISVIPFLFADAGTYTEVGQALGDWIYPQSDRGWVVPVSGLSVSVLARSGMVNSRSFLDVAQTAVYGLAANTPNQQIAINGNGAVYRRSDALLANEALRAIVSTESGESALSPWSAATNALGSLRVTLAYPSNGTTAQIRANYPDAIAGLTGKAQLNAPSVRIYAKSGSTIRSIGVFSLVDGATQEIDLPAWSSGTNTTLPTVAANFSLFAPTSVATAVTGAGDYPSGVQIAYSFVYDGSTVTKISHSTIDGCIHTSRASLAEVEETSAVWATPVLTVAELRTVATTARSPYQSRYLAEKGNAYRWHPGSSETDDGDRAIRPNDIPADQTGRWLKDDGSQLLSGAGVPSNGLGEPGDYYLLTDTANPLFGTLYTKTLAGWEVGVNLKGAKGDPGIALEGEWNGITNYQTDDVVFAGTSSWYAIAPSLNVNPLTDNGATWQPLARGIRFRGNWLSSTTYSVYDLVRRGTKLYLCQQIHSNIDPLVNDNVWPIFVDGFRSRGTYSGATTYSINDIAYFSIGGGDDGSYLYVNEVATSGNAPPNAVYWQLLSRNGAKGDEGPTFNPRGTYDAAATYNRLDLVDFNPGSADDGSYVYINETPGLGNAPPNTTYWQLVALRGSQGPSGSASTSTGLVLVHTATPPETAANEIALWNDNGVLMIRSPSNGASTPVSTGGGGGGGGSDPVGAEIFS